MRTSERRNDLLNGLGLNRSSLMQPKVRNLVSESSVPIFGSGNRRKFLGQSLSIGTGALLANSGFDKLVSLAAAETKLQSASSNTQFNLAEELDYQSPPSYVQKFQKKLIGYPDFKRNILESFTSLEEWEDRTLTAPIEKPQLGYLGDVLTVAISAAQAKRTEPGKVFSYDLIRDSGYSFDPKELEQFAKEMKSGRLASMILAATILNFKLQIGEGQKLSLEELCETSNNALKKHGYYDPKLLGQVIKKHAAADTSRNFSDLSLDETSKLDWLESQAKPANRRDIENRLIMTLYGEKSGQFLISKFTDPSWSIYPFDSEYSESKKEVTMDKLLNDLDRAKQLPSFDD